MAKDDAKVMNKKPRKTRSKTSRFFRDLKSEVKKVVWPTKHQVRNNTLVVLGFMAVTGVIIWSIDLVLSVLMNLLFQAS